MPGDSDSSDEGSSNFITTNVMLGYASKEPTDDTFSQLGGFPLNGDLPERFEGHERRLYVFACKSRECQKKNGTVRALRGTRIQKVKVEKRWNAHDDAKTYDSSGILSTKSSIGNSVFAPNPPSSANSRDNPFSLTASASQNPFSATHTEQASSSGNDLQPQPLSNPFASHYRNLHSASTPAAPRLAGLGEQPPTTSSAGLSSTFAEKARISTFPPEPASKTPWPPEASSPQSWPSYHLDADYESLDPTPPSSSKAKLNIDMDGTSHGKDDEKEAFESAIDKTFQRFADRLAQDPEQVLRYEFGGVPLLYSKSDAVGKLFSAASSDGSTDGKVKTKAGGATSGIPSCPNCGKPRVFELQLVPQAIAKLEKDESGLDGMEWGTIIMGVCTADCGERSVGVGEWGWMEEWVGVQWEEDGKLGRISLAHFCDNHGPTSILCTQALPISCFSCQPRSSASSFDDLDTARDTAADSGKARPILNKDVSFDFGDVHESTSSGGDTFVQSTSTPAIPIAVRSRGGDCGRGYTEKLGRPISGNGNAECVNCSINIPPNVSNRLPPSSPGSPQTSISGPSSPMLRSKLPVLVLDEPESGYGSDSDEGRPVPQHLTPASFDSNTSSSSSHEHTLTYITTHAPIEPATYSNLRRAIVRTLSGEQLPRGLTGGPIFFGTATDGYTIAYTFRLSDKFARGGHRLYSLVALAGFDTRKSYRAISTIWRHFETISEWISDKVNEEARRIQVSDSDGPQISSPPPVSFLTGRNSGADPFGRRSGGVGLKGRSLVEMTGDDHLFAILHIKFVELLQELSR
ncbi:MAG: hypothetical protein Q9217_004983 [Psora testacea]